MGTPVVTLAPAAAGVAQITMSDVDSKNTFSPEFVRDVRKCFEEVVRDERYRAVVLTGYGHYFACGGTKEELLRIQRGEATFDELRFYRLALDCELPVVAAMQGHAIGGGLVFGLYADLVVLGRENVYTANFMRYGFTPGLGATLIVPERLGASLGRELLFTGGNYRGDDLARRGVPFPVVPKKEVLDVAHRLAQALADEPRLALTTLKERFAKPLRERLEEAVRLELGMHARTFRHPEVAARIETLFGAGATAPSSLSRQEPKMHKRAILEALQQGRISQTEALAGLRALPRQDVGAAAGASGAGSGAPSAGLDRSRAFARWSEPIAVVGMSGRFPGADDLGAFWSNLTEGVCSVREVPRSRWDMDAVYDAAAGVPGKTYSRWAGLLNDVDRFDPLFFSISPREAELMDPQQRLFLEEAWRALEDAGYAPKALAGARCGVFAGVGPGDYQYLLAASGLPPDAYTLVGNAASILAARIAYLLDLRGPCLAIDTASSSSAVAVHQACQSLRAGECDLALAGGVCVLTTPQTHIMTSQAGMLSRTGLCRTFDQSADGFVPAEGVGVLVLRPLGRALAAGDHVYGVITGSGLSHNGSTNGITAPSAQAQRDLQSRVYRDFGLDPATLGYVECHGTATKLGDPIEMEALRDVFRRYTARTQFCPVGAAKTNIGHAIAAAGVASLIKVLLSLSRRQLVPSLHFSVPNEHIPFADSPFYVNTALREWAAAPGVPRRAAVNSIGFSGTIVHFALEEAPAPDAQATPRRRDFPLVVPLSARSPERLRAYAERVRAFLEPGGPDAPHLADLAHTFQVGRVPLAHRAVFVAEDRDDLARKLRAFAAGHDLPRGVYCGLAPPEGGASGAPAGDEAPQRTRTAGQATALAEAWVRGQAVDWGPTQDPGRPPRRIPAPTYPFARERYWVPAPAESPAAHQAAAASMPAALTAEGARDASVEAAASLLLAEEDWLERPVVADDDWVAAVEAWSGASLAVVHQGEQERREFEAVLQGLADAFARSGKPRAFTWRYVDAGPDAAPIEPALGALDAVIMCLPAPESPETPAAAARADACVERACALVDDGRKGRRVDVIAVCGASARGTWGEWDALEARLARLAPDDGQSALAVVRHDFDANDPRRFSLAVREWLATPADPVARRRVIHHAGGGRFERRVREHAPQPALDAHLRDAGCYVVAGHLGETALALCEHADRLHGARLELVPQGPLAAAARARIGRLAAQRLHPGPAQAALDAAQRVDGVICFLGSPAASEAPLVPALIEKHWREADAAAPAGEARPAGNGLVLSAVHGAPIAAEIARRLGGAVVVAPGDDGDDTLARSRSFGWLVDLADLHPDLRGHDGDKLPRLRVYRTVVARSSDLAVLHVTRRLQAVGGGPTSLAGAKLAGLTKVLAAECPRVRARGVDLDLPLHETAAIADVVVRELQRDDGEVEVCYRGGRRYVPFLAPRAWPADAPAETLPDPGLPVVADGVYVVTGGTSGIGAETARHLVSRGARKLVLTGITPLPPRDQWQACLSGGGTPAGVAQRVAFLQGLAAEGVALEVHVGPLDDEPALTALFARVRREWGPLRGVVHSAGRMPSARGASRGFIAEDEDELRRILAPKVAGLELLARITHDDPLDFFIAFSSVAAWIPRLVAGVGAYGLANCFVDHFVTHQLRAGRARFRSVAWTGWTDAGVHARAEGGDRRAQALVRACGLGFNSTPVGLRLIEQAASAGAEAGNLLAGTLDPPAFQACQASLLRAPKPDGAQARPARAAPSEVSAPLAALDQATSGHEIGFFAVVSSGAGAAGHEARAVARSFAAWRQERVQRGLRHGTTLWVHLCGDPVPASARGVARALAQACAVAAQSATSARAGSHLCAGVAWDGQLPTLADLGLGAALPARATAGPAAFESLMAQLLAVAPGERERLFAEVDLAPLDDEQIDALHAVLLAPAVPEAHDDEDLGYAEVERLILRELSVVLKLERASLGRADRLQSFGLDSISGTQLAVRLERALEMEIPPRWLIEDASAETLARRIAQARRDGRGAAVSRA